MMTLIALCALCLQDPPQRDKPRPQDPEARERAAKDLEKRAMELREQIDSLPKESTIREEKSVLLKRTEAEIQRLRTPVQPPQPPEPPRGPEGGDRRRPNPPLSAEERDRLVQSEEELNVRIEKNPKDAAAYWTRGETRQRLGNAEGAAGDFQKARQMDPEFRGRNVPMPPRRGPEGVPMPDGPLRTVENPDEIRAWLKENEAGTFKRMMRAQDEGRRPEVMQILSEAEPRMRQMIDMKEHDPKGYERVKEMHRLDAESLELAERARRTEAPDERERLAKQLAETLGKLFDLREENRVLDVAQLKKRVESLEKELSNRKANKEKIIDQRRRELLGAKGEFDW